MVDEELDLESVFSSYAGRGSLPHRPDLLLKMVLYEHQNGRPQPTQWLEDLEKNTSVQWLTFGIRAPRSTLYEFRDRIQPFLAGLNQQVIRTAIAEKHTDASKASLDGTFVAANASRHRLLSLKTVEQRLEQLDQEIAKIEAAEAAKQQSQARCETAPTRRSRPAWLRRFRHNRRPSQISNRQRHRLIGGADVRPRINRARSWPRQSVARSGSVRNIAKAQEILKERNKTNAQRRKDKRKKSEQVRVAIGDPMAPFGRDKMKVFRPLYNVQTMTDVKTDFVFAFSVTPTLSDSGHLVPMIDQTTAVTEQVLKMVLADSGYPSGDDLAKCEAMKGVGVRALE